MKLAYYLDTLTQMTEYSIKLIRDLIQMNVDYGFKSMNIKFDTVYHTHVSSGANLMTGHTTEILIEIDKTKENNDGTDVCANFVQRVFSE